MSVLRATRECVVAGLELFYRELRALPCRINQYHDFGDDEQMRFCRRCGVDRAEPKEYRRYPPNVRKPW